MVLALGGLLLVTPALLLIAAAVRLSSPGPVLFRQQRVGRGGAPFILLKFRTMWSSTGPGVTAAGDPRVTRIGGFLRATKLDELPELWNVLRGEMALVGPRPEVPRFVRAEDGQWRLILSTRPGLTDPVTLRLRNEEGLLARAPGDPEDFYLQVLQPYKLREYCHYLARRTWREDLSVLVRTALTVVGTRGPAPPSLEELGGGHPW